MTDIERVKKVINWYIYQDVGQNNTEIATKLGYTKSSFSQILGGKVPISKKFIEKLCSLDENINFVWVETGSGEMLRSPSDQLCDPRVEYGNHPSKAPGNKNTECQGCKDKERVIAALEKTILSKEETIEAQKDTISALKKRPSGARSA